MAAAIKLDEDRLFQLVMPRWRLRAHVLAKIGGASVDIPAEFSITPCHERCTGQS